MSPRKAPLIFCAHRTYASWPWPRRRQPIAGADCRGGDSSQCAATGGRDSVAAKRTERRCD